jgi:hypothetical protein
MYGAQSCMTRGLAPVAESRGMQAQMSTTRGPIRSRPSQEPAMRVRLQSAGSCAPKDWATRVSIPRSRPMPLTTTG